MTIEFRCEKCGKLLSVEGEPPAKVRCQYCNAKVAVPAGLASLPRPQAPPGANGAPPPPPGAPPAEGEEQLELGQDALMDTMAKLMPWVISLFFHAGILVILAFLTIVAYTKKKAEAQPIVPDAKLAERKPGADRFDLDKTKRQVETKTITESRDWESDTQELTENPTRLTVPLPSDVGWASRADLGGTQGGGLKGAFLGLGGNCYHIVLVVDRSGSMLDHFDRVKREVTKTISQLQDVQTFHLVFFAHKEGVAENRPRRLVLATEANVGGAVKFLESVEAGGGSPTNPLEALKRGFDVLANPPNDKKGKILFLLTDGDFHDNAEVRRKIKQWNAKKDVAVNTILYATGGPDIRRALRQIATENGGKFRFEGGN